MFMLLNAEMTPKRRERSERAKILELFDFVSRLLWFLMKIEMLNNHLNL